MIALGIVLVVLLLICLVRIGVVAVYSEDGFTVDAYIAPVRIQVLPTQGKTKGKKKDKKKKKAKTADTAVKAGRLESLKNQLPSLNKALSRLKRKLRVNELTIYYMAAGLDPAATALYFGAASAGYGIILPLLENNFNIKKRDLRAAVNFEATEPYIYVKAKLSLAVWEVFYVGFGLVKNLVMSENMRAKFRKAV